MKRRRPRITRVRTAFTLVEVLVSATLLSVILVIMWGTFANSHRTREVATLRHDSIRGAEAALRRMQREISMAFVTKIGEIPTNEAGEVTYQTAFIGSSDRLDFASFAHMQVRVGDVGSEQAEVAYYLRSERGPDGRLHQNLVRREQAPIDGEPEDGGYVYTLLEDVEDIEFEYWRADREIAGNAWERQWDTRDTGVVGLPPRVRVTVEVLNPICRAARSRADEAECQRAKDNLVFVIEADIPLTYPIGFGFDSGVSEAEFQAALEANQQLESVLADESDDPDEGAFDDNGDQRSTDDDEGGR